MRHVAIVLATCAHTQSLLQDICLHSHTLEEFACSCCTCTHHCLRLQEYLLKICITSSTADTGVKPSRRLQAASADCAEGKEPLWSSELIHKVHILIFLIAISHVLYAMCSLAISMRAVRKWRRYERVAQSGELLDLPVAQLQREGEHKIWFGIRQGLRQFTHPIDAATYVALRRMFVETMQVCTKRAALPSCMQIPLKLVDSLTLTFHIPTLSDRH